MINNIFLLAIIFSTADALLLKEKKDRKGIGPTWPRGPLCAGPGKILLPGRVNESNTLISEPCPLDPWKSPAVNVDTTGQIDILILFVTSCYPCPLKSVLCPFFLWQCAYLAKPKWWIRDQFNGPPTGMTVGNCAKLGYSTNNGMDGWHPQLESHTWEFGNFPNKSAIVRALETDMMMSIRTVFRVPWCAQSDMGLLFPGTSDQNQALARAGPYCPICSACYLMVTNQFDALQGKKAPSTLDCKVLCNTYDLVIAAVPDPPPDY